MIEEYTVILHGEVLCDAENAGRPSCGRVRKRRRTCQVLGQEEFTQQGRLEKAEPSADDQVHPPGLDARAGTGIWIRNGGKRARKRDKWRRVHRALGTGGQVEVMKYRVAISAIRGTPPEPKPDPSCSRMVSMARADPRPWM